MLAAACKKLNRKKRKYWATHVHRNVQHHSGWIPVMQRMKILTQTASRLIEPMHAATWDVGNSSRRMTWLGVRSGLHFDSTKKYKVVPFCKSHLSHFRRTSRMQSSLLAMRIPSTLGEWIQSATEFKKAGGSDNYSSKWLFRSVMIAEMRACGIRSLTSFKKANVSQLATAFPDQCPWLQKLPQTMPLARALKDWRYEGPIELFTMYLCIFCTCTQMTASEITERAKQIKKRRREWDEACRPAHPAVVLASVM